MSLKTNRCLPFLFAVLSLSVLTYSNQPESSPGEIMAQMAELGKELATPDENHLFLTQLAGEWTTSSTMMGMEPTSGSASYEMILGGRFLDGTHEGVVMGIPFQGRLTFGYDTYKHKFVASFIDDLGTSLRYAEGTLDKSGAVLSLWGQMDEWMTDEHDKMVLYRIQIQSPTSFTFEIHDLALGDESKVIEVQYIKRAPSEEGALGEQS